MMREIKLRAWNDGAMIYSHNNSINHSNIQIEWFFKVIRKDAVIMQYTGLNDKNGKEIYEGDILRYRYARDTTKTDVVEFDEVVEWENTTNFVGFSVNQLMEDHEVIGNLYENPELLTT